MLVFVARNRNICSQFTMPQLLDYLEQQLNDSGLDAFKFVGIFFFVNENFNYCEKTNGKKK